MSDMEIDNTADPFEGGGDFLAGVAPKVTIHTSPQLKTDFAPWHKPRKQWIRDCQWGRLTVALIKRLGLRDSGRPLSYLSLPGVDLLDVRSLEDVLNENNVKLSFLGLNFIERDAAEVHAEQALSLNEVRSLDFVDKNSSVINERFEDLCNTDSIANQRVLEKHKTFDIINIDLCASFARHKPGTWNSLYTAIHKLVAHQAFYRSEDWVFLITSRNDKSKVDAAAFAALIGSVVDSFGDEIASSYIEEKFGINYQEFKSAAYSQARLSSLEHRNCFTSAFGIWKLRLLIGGSPSSKTDMHEPYGYHVESDDAITDMVSMSFWCSRLPQAHADLSGLSGFKPEDQDARQREVFKNSADKIVKSSLACIDLDRHLIDNPPEFEQAVTRSKSLLKKARYSIDKYEEWVEIQQSKITQMVNSNQAAAR
ncbi:MULTISPECIES: hypothetical protein [unclassified Pseudomonas]|uniref:PP_RS20740 family protein n=1 Tax=unclassified Pseudomonas TaxID=196821 RepID=UPI0015A4A8C1|nr:MULTISPECIES: hypothetical protein [unclassified Pseudomonas]NWB23940.1 hypothetical protein [Pseudomonas sp. D4002]NWB64258.1 hypothetical protein [Pseudomonas sp. F1002]